MAIIVILVLLWNQYTLRKKEIGPLKEKQKLVAQIPAMEAKLKSIKEVVQPEKFNFVISGIYIQDGVPMVVSGDNFYREGDSVDSYVISKITFNSVVLEEKDTHLKKELVLPEKPY